MERGLFLKRFICEHQVVPNLDRGLLKNMHRTLRQEINVLYTFSNLTEKCMYSVIESHDRLTVESFFSDMRIPWDRIVEVDLQGEGREKLEDLTIRWAA
jgi:hypothetical protein